MIRTLAKAKAVQRRREKASLPGISAAVRRFCRRQNRPYADVTGVQA